MRGRAQWNKAHYRNANTGCCNNLHRKATQKRQGQYTTTTLEDNERVLKYEEEQ